MRTLTAEEIDSRTWATGGAVTLHEIATQAKRVPELELALLRANDHINRLLAIEGDQDA